LGREGNSSKCADSNGKEEGVAREKDPAASKIEGEDLQEGFYQLEKFLVLLSVIFLSGHLFFQ